MVLKSNDARGRAGADRPAPVFQGGIVKVRMRHQMSGTRDGVDWPAPGGEIDLPDGEAAALCAQGMAEPAGAPDAGGEGEPEKATAPAAEKRARARKS